MSTLSLIKTFGGKGNKRVLKWIISNFPTDYTQRIYIEPFGGGATVLLNKLPSIEEVYNDLDTASFNVIWCAKANTIYPIVSHLIYSENVFNQYKSYAGYNPLDIGIQEYVLRNMSRSALKKDFAWSERKRGGLPGDVNAWNNKVTQLPKIAQRLSKIKFFNEDALITLRRFNSTNSFAYLDPPYVSSTRVTKKVYTHEMTDSQHMDLLSFIVHEWKGLCLISNYDNILYSDMLMLINKGWTQRTLDISNNAGQTKKKSNRVECLWRNY